MNIASRLEGLTRTLETDLVMSESFIEKLCLEAVSAQAIAEIEDLVQIGGQSLRGHSGAFNVYILPKVCNQTADGVPGLDSCKPSPDALPGH